MGNRTRSSFAPSLSLVLSRLWTFVEQGECDRHGHCCARPRGGPAIDCRSVAHKRLLLRVQLSADGPTGPSKFYRSPDITARELSRHVNWWATTGSSTPWKSSPSPPT